MRGGVIVMCHLWRVFMVHETCVTNGFGCCTGLEGGVEVTLHPLPRASASGPCAV